MLSSVSLIPNNDVNSKAEKNGNKEYNNDHEGQPVFDTLIWRFGADAFITAAGVALAVQGAELARAQILEETIFVLVASRVIDLAFVVAHWIWIRRFECLKLDPRG